MDQRSNRLLGIITIIMSAVVAVLLLLAVLTGTASTKAIIQLVVYAIIIILAIVMMSRSNNASQATPIILYSYLVGYLLTALLNNVFVVMIYIIPVLVVSLLLSNPKLLNLGCIVGIIGTIIMVARNLGDPVNESNAILLGLVTVILIGFLNKTGKTMTLYTQSSMTHIVTE